MSKKAKRLKRQMRYRYSKKEFMDIVCSQSCKLCPKGTEPTLCFDEFHKNDKALFFNRILPKLINSKKAWIDYSGVANIYECGDEVIEHVFVESFCKSGACEPGGSEEKPCEHLTGCIHAFRDSMSKAHTEPVSFEEDDGQSKRKKKQKQRFIPERYATFFCSQGFEEEFRRIINGNSIEEQDADPELPKSTEGANFRQAQNTQSNMG